MIARLRVEHQQWDEGMRKAQKGVDDLQKSTGGMDAMMGKAMKSVGAMAAALATVDAAGKAFNKTIGGSQTLTDSWGRTMQASTRAVDGFFESLAQGSFQSFLGGLDNMIAKAREAYDAIDTLGTYDIFAGPLKAKYEAEIRKLKYEIRAGVGNADEKKAQIRDIEDKMLGLAGRESFLSGDAARKLLASYTNAQGGTEMLEKLFMSGDQAQNVALEMYTELEKKHKTVRRPVSWYGKGITDEQAKKRGYDGVDLWGKPYRLDWDDDKDARAVAESLKAFGEKGDERLKEVAALYARQYQAQAKIYAQKMENLETLNFKGAGGGGAGKEYTAQKFDVTGMKAPGMGVTSSMAELEGQLAQWQQALKEATTSAGMQAAESMIVELQRLIDAQPIALRLDVPEESIAEVVAQMQDLGDRIRNDVKPLDTSTLFMGNDGNPLEKTGKDVEKITENIGKTSQAFGMMGNAMQMLEDRGIIPDISDLPKPPSGGEAALRLRQEEQLVAKGLHPNALEDGDPLRLYLEEVAMTPAFGDEQLLAEEVLSGSERAMEQLTNLSLSRVIELAQGYVGRGVLLMDLIQEGSLGLWQAIQN